MLEHLIDSIKDALLENQVPEDVVRRVQFSEPPHGQSGDLAIGCFVLAQHWGCKPPEAAVRLRQMLVTSAVPVREYFESGPYLNCRVDTDWLVRSVVRGIKVKKQVHPRIMLEYSQPNTHKEYHIGHLRNACYGGALVALHRAVGQNILAATYNNDVGSHVAKTLWAYKKFHAHEKPPREKGRWIAGMYVEATRALEAHPEYKEEVSDVLRKLESRDKAWHKLWKQTRQWSLDEFHAIYRELGLKFEVSFDESAIKNRGHRIVDQLLKQGAAKESDGAIIMDFEAQKKGVLILRKSDGAGNYTTSDLALAEEKFKRFSLDEAIIVTDNRQDLYFEQLFMTLHAFGFKQKLTHLSYDLVTLPEGAMSSRKGNVILYEDLRDEVVEAALAETKARHPEWKPARALKTARALAIAAIKFSMVRQSPQKIIVFDKKEALAFDGFTAPYLEYTLARIHSIFKKTRRSLLKPKGYVWNETEHALWFALGRSQTVIARAAAENDPSEVAKYCFDLAKAFSSYYENNRVLDEDRTVRSARLMLVRKIEHTLSSNMKLLGLPLLKEM